MIHDETRNLKIDCFTNEQNKEAQFKEKMRKTV